MSNTNILFFNMFFNSGTIITNVRNLVLYFYDRDYTRVKNVFQFGTEMGQIFWYVFYPLASTFRRRLIGAAPFSKTGPGTIQ